MRTQPPVTALIPAAGRGERFGAEQNKVFAELLGRPVLGWTLEAFAQCAEIARIVLVAGEGETEVLWELGDRYGAGKLQAVVLGGSTRQESVRRGLDAVGTDFVLIHDAARCCVTPAFLSECVGVTRTYQAMTVVRPIADTLMRRSGEIIDRTELVAVETPQGFQTELLRRAHASARAAASPRSQAGRRPTGRSIHDGTGPTFDRRSTMTSAGK